MDICPVYFFFSVSLSCVYEISYSSAHPFSTKNYSSTIPSSSFTPLVSEQSCTSLVFWFSINHTAKRCFPKRLHRDNRNQWQIINRRIHPPDPDRYGQKSLECWDGRFLDRSTQNQEPQSQNITRSI